MRETILYFDCFSGAAGDMILGALVDAGLPVAELRRVLATLPIEGLDVDAERVVRGGVGATKFRVKGADAGHDHHHHHHHDPHGHAAAHGSGRDGAHGHASRGLSDILALVERSGLSPPGKQRAAGLFRRLAEVEAGVHQVPVESVHLHEVGAVDSIADIIGAVHGLEWFGPDRIVASPLNVGGGTVRTAHGVFPVPAPATIKLLEGIPVYSSGVETELTTPTGALIVGSYARSFGPLPAMQIRQIGYGAGDRDLPDRPNVLRVVLGEAATPAAASTSGGVAGSERVLVLQCEVDDINPQILGALMEELHTAGAVDVLYSPVQMKKNRPGTLVTVVAPPAARETLTALIFRETTTLGVRTHEVERERLERAVVTVETGFGPIRVKVARRAGAVVNASPEFDDCARAARRAGVPIKEVLAAATSAYLARRSAE